MPANYYLELDNIKGESRDAEHKGQIELLSFQFGVSHPGGRMYGSGGGTGQAQVGDIIFTKYSDKSTPVLMQYCVLHKDIPNAKIHGYKAAGDKRVKYLEIHLKEVVISNYDTNGADGVAMENGALNFAEIKYVYKEQSTTQTPGGPVEWAYNIPEHQAK